MSGQTDELRGFLDALFGSTTGYLTGAVGHDGRFDTKGSYKFAGGFVPFAFEWPDRADDAVFFIRSQSQQSDVYTCMYLMRTPQRHKGNAVSLRLVHVDMDDAVDTDKVRALGGFVVPSGSPGHGHVYVLLSEEITEDQHEVLGKALRDHLGGDKGKFAHNDVLRPPRSINQKPRARGQAQGEQVGMPGPLPPPVDPQVLAGALGVDIDNIAPKAATNGSKKTSGKAKPSPTPVEAVDLAAYPGVLAEFAVVTSDRSKDTFRIVAACADAGLNLAQARYVVGLRSDLGGRVDGRNDDDIARCWDRAWAESPRNTWAVPGTSAAAGGGAGVPPAAGGGAGGGGAVDLDDAHIAPHIADGWLRDRFLMTGEFGWLKYDGRRWAAVPEVAVGEAVRQAVIEMHAVEAQAGATAKRLAAISGLFSAHKIFSIVRISKGYLLAEGAEFDAHPDLLNCANGVVNLRDGSLSPHDPGLRFTKLCPTRYVKGATHPDWDKALEALPDAVTAGWLQVRFGQGLTGYPAPDDVLVFLRGTGENAKTTWVLAIRMSVGPDYAVKLSDRVLLANKGDHPTELMELRGARLAIAEELPDQHLNTKRIKDTQGDSGMSARYCGKDTMKWEETHTMFATTNHFPGVDDQDHAVWRRLEMVQFPYRYRKPHEPLEGPLDRYGDSGLRGRLKRGRRQREAVLAWLVEGSVLWYRDGLPEPPPAVRAAKREWQLTADLLLRFAVDNLVPAKGYHVISTEWFEAFSDWLRANGNAPWSDQTFSNRLESHQRMKTRGVSKKRTSQSAKGQTLSRRPVATGQWATSNRPNAVPDKYTAWLGVRFRTRGDPFDDSGLNGW